MKQLDPSRREKLNRLGSADGYFDFDGNRIGLGDWSELYEDIEGRTLARTRVGDHEVATVWFGVDDSCGTAERPLIIGTVTRDLSGKVNGSFPEWLWPDRTEALAGHERYVAEVHGR